MSNDYRVRKAARCLCNGGVIAYPTEGIYGIGCLPQFSAAIERVIDIKRRNAAAGLILIAADVELLTGWIAPTSEELQNLLRPIDHPTTWVVTAQAGLDPLLTGGRPTLAVRITDHPVAAALSLEVGGPLVSTSANRSGTPPTLSALHARIKLGEKLDLVLNGPLGGATGASEIRIAKDDRVIRPYS